MESKPMKFFIIFAFLLMNFENIDGVKGKREKQQKGKSDRKGDSTSSSGGDTRSAANQSNMPTLDNMEITDVIYDEFYSNEEKPYLKNLENYKSKHNLKEIQRHELEDGTNIIKLRPMGDNQQQDKNPSKKEGKSGAGETSGSKNGENVGANDHQNVKQHGQKYDESEKVLAEGFGKMFSKKTKE